MHRPQARPPFRRTKPVHPAAGRPAPGQGMEHASLVAMNQRNPAQRIIKIRRDYNTWVADETLEDYALRFTPRSFRKWSRLCGNVCKRWVTGDVRR